MSILTDDEIIDRMLAAANSACPMGPVGQLQVSREAIMMHLAAIRAYEECKEENRKRAEAKH